jgi:pimeloyl-ACP methyl ester carboxylesterase
MRPGATLHWRSRRVRSALAALFRILVPQRSWELPTGARPLAARSADGVPLAGWAMVPERPRATALILHGLLRNCTLDGIPAWGRRFAGEGIAVAACDFRAHGRSGDSIPSFGAAEAGDVRAMLDACVAAGLPPPYLVIGGSLGALAAQRAALDDDRIAALALVAPPGWPRRAARVGGRAVAQLARVELSAARHGLRGACFGRLAVLCGAMAPLLCRLIDVAYEHPMMDHADPRRFRPRRAVPVLVTIGDADVFDWRAAASAWRSWRGRGDRAFADPATRPRQRAWFVLAPGYGHPPFRGNLLEWPGLEPLIETFVRTALRLHG